VQRSTGWKKKRRGKKSKKTVYSSGQTRKRLRGRPRETEGAVLRNRGGDPSESIQPLKIVSLRNLSTYLTGLKLTPPLYLQDLWNILEDVTKSKQKIPSSIVLTPVVHDLPWASRSNYTIYSFCYKYTSLTVLYTKYSSKLLFTF
jgi:hypothetical protein